MKNPKLTEHIHKLERLIAFPKEAGRMFFYEALHNEQFTICKGGLQTCRMVPGKTCRDSSLQAWITDQSEYSKIRREAAAWNRYAYHEEYRQRMASSSPPMHRQ